MCCARPRSPGCRRCCTPRMTAGRPYHVVHFDGHGTWLDLADLGIEPDGADGGGAGGGGGGVGVSPLHVRGVGGRAGAARASTATCCSRIPGSAENQQLADGPALGRLLTDTGVPVLVLNACRSAYAEARDQPADAPGPSTGRRRDRPRPPGTATGWRRMCMRGSGRTGRWPPRSPTRACPGVVAMRYNVYVVTAAQFVADLYAHLLAGQSLGQAATAARRALAADPVRQIGAVAGGAAGLGRPGRLRVRAAGAAAAAGPRRRR